MKLTAFLGTALAAAALLIGVQGCSTENAASGGTHCTPGNYVFCRCADRAEGTKLCKADGETFEACSTGASGECAGGEDLTDPMSGQEVDPPTETGPDKEPEKAGPPGSPVDSCPGKPTAITPGAELVIEGDTTGAKADFKGKTGACASGDGGADHVYHLQPTGSGSLSIKVQGDLGMDALFYLRSSCADEATQVACAPPLGASKLVQLTTNVVAGQDYYLVVDGASGSAGKYKLTTKLTTGAFCGDGKVDSGEACDDGNHTDGDGCSAGCNGIAGDPTSGGSCPGQPVDMWQGRVVTGTGSTLPYANTFTKTGTSCDVSASNLNVAQDHVYAVTAHSAGTLKVTLTPTEATFNAQLVARKTCADATTQGAAMCANSGSAGAAETMSFPVTSGQTVYVAAEGVLNGKGSYTIKFELP